MQTIFQWFKTLNKESLCLLSREKKPVKGDPFEAMSNSEIQRIFEQGAILINGEKVTTKELLDFPIISVVLYPKSDTNKITIF